MVAGVDFRRSMPDDVILEMGVDHHTAVLALKHGPRLGAVALLEALSAPSPRSTLSAPAARS
jgi:xanthine dehydrogenase accessory factor